MRPARPDAVTEYITQYGAQGQGDRGERAPCDLVRVLGLYLITVIMHSQSDFPQLQRTFFESVSDSSIVVVSTSGGF